MNVKELMAKSNPKFKDFMALRVGGRDEYSLLRYSALKSRVSIEAIAATEAAIEVQAERAKVYRWILRGLPLDYAIRKINTDLEVVANAKYSRRGRKDEAHWS